MAAGMPWAHRSVRQAHGPHVPLSTNSLLLFPSPTNLQLIISAYCDHRQRSCSPVRRVYTAYHRRQEDVGAVVGERGGEYHEQHHGHHRRESPQPEEVRQVRRRRLRLRAGQEAVRWPEQEVRPSRPGRWKVRRRAAVEEQEDIVERARRRDRRLGLLRVARLPLPDHRVLPARSRHGCPVRLVQLRRHAQRVPVECASRRVAGGVVCEHRRGRRRACEQGPGPPAGRVVWKRPQAVSPGDRRVLRGRFHRELVQFAYCHLHRVCVCTHSACAL